MRGVARETVMSGTCMDGETGAIETWVDNYSTVEIVDRVESNEINNEKRRRWKYEEMKDS